MREWWSDAWPVLRPVWPVGAILLATVLVAWLGRPLPESLAGLRVAGPYAVLGAAAAVAMWFNCGRAFVLAASGSSPVCAQPTIAVQLLLSSSTAPSPLPTSPNSSWYDVTSDI